MSLALPRAHAPMIGYLVSGGLSNLGNALSGVIYPWLVYDLTGSAAAMGIVAFVATAPLVIGAFAGSVVVDRIGVRPVALAADGLSAATAIALASLHALGALTLEIVVVLAALGAIMDGPGAIAHDARWPEIARVARLPLVRANVLDDLLDNGAYLAGPVLAGLALAVGGSRAGLTIVAAVSAAAFLSTLMSLPSFHAGYRQGRLALAECLAGPRFILATASLRNPLILTAIGMALFVSIESVALPAILRIEGRPATALGLFLGATAIGAVAINLTLLALRAPPAPRLIFPSAFLGFAAALLALAIDRSSLTLAAAGVLLGLAAGPLAPLLQTLLQVVPPKALRARVLGSAFGLVMAAAPVSALIAGFVIEYSGGEPVLHAAAIIALTGGLAAVAVVQKDDAAMGADLRTPVPTTHASTNARPAALPPSSGRVSLARLSLIYEWKRYLAAVLAVAFSGLLLLVQLGLLLGMFGTVTTVVDKAPADLWVVGRGTQSFDLAREMPARVEMRLRAHPDVAAVQTMTSGAGDWRRPDGGGVLVYLTGIDITRQSLSLPSTFSEHDRRALEPLGAVIVDEVDLGKLGVKIGDTVEINRKRATVAATTTGMRAIGGANVFGSQATVRWLLGESAPLGSAYYLLRLNPAADIATVQAELQAAARALGYRIMKPNELSVMSQLYWLLESGSGAGFGFATILGLMVGVAITSQTLRAAVLSAIREYATLRALGVSLGALRAVVIEQSAWIGAAGLAITGALTALVALIAHAVGIAVLFPWWSIIAATLFTLSVALLSGYLSLKPLYATEPAELLR